MAERLTKEMSKCEGWCEPFSAPATKSVIVKDGVRWFTIWLCDIHCVEFVRDTELERSTGEVHIWLCENPSWQIQ